MMPPTFGDLDTLARTIEGEASREPYCGKVAVAWVIKTRANKALAYKLRTSKPHPLFGDGSIRTACVMPSQFSCWLVTDPNRQRILNAKTGALSRTGALQAAFAVLAGEEPDPTAAADHYYNPATASPPWANGLTPCAVIGNHRFFNDVP